MASCKQHMRLCACIHPCIICAYMHAHRAKKDSRCTAGTACFSGIRFVSNLLSHQFSFRALFQSRVLRVVLKQSAAVALLSGAITSIAYHFNVWEIFRQDDPAAFIASDEPLHTGRVQGFTNLTSSYKFFPSFLLLGYLSYMIVR